MQSELTLSIDHQTNEFYLLGNVPYKMKRKLLFHLRVDSTGLEPVPHGLQPCALPVKLKIQGVVAPAVYAPLSPYQCPRGLYRGFTRYVVRPSDDHQLGRGL